MSAAKQQGQGGDGGRSNRRKRRGRGRRPGEGGGSGSGGGGEARQQPRRDDAQGGGNKGGNKGGGNKNRNRSGRRNRGRGGSQRQDEAAFWGAPNQLPEPRLDVRITDDPAAVARSLGSPPLPGHEQIAQNYFTLVYDRAVTTAGALAAAGGLIDPDALAEELAD